MGFTSSAAWPNFSLSLLPWEKPATHSGCETRRAHHRFGLLEVARARGGSARGTLRCDPMGNPAQAAALVAAIDRRRGEGR